MATISRKGCLRPILIGLILATSFSIAAMYLVYTRGQYPLSSSNNGVFWIVGAQVFDGDSLLAGNPSILIRDGKIACMGADCEIPADARTIQAAGMTLLPGLTDMQVQFYRPTKEYEGLSNPERLLRFTKQRPEVRKNLHLSGVTQIRSCGDALENILALRHQIASGKFAGPEVFLVGPMITAPGGHPVATEFAEHPYLIQEAARQVTGANEMKSEIKELSRAGVNGIKMVYTGFGGKLPKLELEALAAGLTEAHERHLPTFVLTGTEQEMIDAAREGATAIEYGALGPFEPETLASLRDREVAWIPVLSRAQEDSVLMKSLQEGVLQAHEAGLWILPGSEPGEGEWMGRSLFREMVLLVEAGIGPAEVIRGATSGAALVLKAETRLGHIHPGYEANLILVAGDPTKDIHALRQIKMLWQSGVLMMDQGVLLED